MLVVIGKIRNAVLCLLCKCVGAHIYVPISIQRLAEKRDCVIKELLTTERNYVMCLTHIIGTCTTWPLPPTRFCCSASQIYIVYKPSYVYYCIVTAANNRALSKTDGGGKSGGREGQEGGTGPDIRPHQVHLLSNQAHPRIQFPPAFEAHRAGGQPVLVAYLHLGRYIR